MNIRSSGWHYPLINSFEKSGEMRRWGLWLWAGSCLVPSLLGQSLVPTNYQVMALDSIVSFYPLMMRHPKLLSRARNAPFFSFHWGDWVCALYISGYNNPFLWGSDAYRMWTLMSFLGCVNGEGQFRMLPTHYPYEKVKKTGRRWEDVIREEGFSPGSVGGIPEFVALEKKLLMVYTYNYKQVTSEKNKVQRQYFLFVKEYDENLSLVGTRKTAYEEEVWGRRVVRTSIHTVEVARISSNQYIVAYVLTKSMGGNRQAYLVVNLLDEDSRIVNKTMIHLPFDFRGMYPVRLHYWISEKHRKVFFMFPVVLLQEEANNLFKKLLSKGESGDPRALYVVIYQVDPVSGEYTVGAIDLGNPQKKVISQVIRANPDEDNYLIGFVWTFKKQKKFAVDMLKLSIGEDGELVLQDKFTVSVPSTDYSPPPAYKFHIVVTDIAESKNSYMVALAYRAITKITTKTSSWLEIAYYAPFLLVIDKGTRSVKKVLSLPVRKALRMSAGLLDDYRLRVLAARLMRILKYDDQTFLILYSLFDSKVARRIRTNAELNYMIVSELDNGAIEVTRPRPLGPAVGNVTSWTRNVIRKNQKIYSFYSIDYFVPAVAEFELRK